MVHESVSHAVNGLTYVRAVGIASDQGLRPEMEDAFVFKDCFAGLHGATCGMVFDGHGGTDCVSFVEQRLLQMCEEELIREMGYQEQHGVIHLDSIVSRAVGNAFQLCDQAFVRQQKGSGSTCAMVLTMYNAETGGRRLYSAHLGDTRAVLCRQGIALRLTSLSDHRASDVAEQAEVRRRGGEVVNDRVNGSLSVTRAFGDHFLKAPIQTDNVVSCVPDVTALDIIDPADAFIILACDGIFDVMSDQEAVNLVMEGWVYTVKAIPGLIHDHPSTLTELLARTLVEEALQRGSTDNCTVQIILL